MRRIFLATGISAVLVVSGVASAAFLGSPPESASGAEVVSGLFAPSGNLADEAIYGGPIERFHRANPCDLADVSALPGNWTHGEYVDAVAAGGNPVLIQRAAMSNCGKPMVAVEHGGPPAHALANMARRPGQGSGGC